MKKDILSLTLSTLCVLSACSNDDEEWRYGEEQALNATESVSYTHLTLPTICSV